MPSAGELWNLAFSVLSFLSWRKEALTGYVSFLRRPALALAALRVPEEPTAAWLKPCLSLSVVCGRQNCVYSHSKQFHRCGLSGCHVLPHEVPDLVWCVFLKAHPLPPKTSVRVGKTFLVELPVCEPVSDYALLWPRYAVLPTNSLSEGLEFISCLGQLPQTDMETEAEGGQGLHPDHMIVSRSPSLLPL